jgi:hypothetical protein
MPENNIVPSQSEAESLRLEIMRLRAEVLDLTAERDRLKYRVCPAILADYNRRIGQIELEIMEVVLRVRKLRRMIEVLQAARNRGEDPDYEEAVRTADSEYRAYEQEVHEKAEEYRNASAVYQRGNELAAVLFYDDRHNAEYRHAAQDEDTVNVKKREGR